MNYIICSSSIRHILAYYCAVVKMFLAVSCACLFDTDRGSAGAFMTDPSGLFTVWIIIGGVYDRGSSTNC